MGAALSTVVDHRMLLLSLAIVTAFAGAFLTRVVEPVAGTIGEGATAMAAS